MPSEGRDLRLRQARPSSVKPYPLRLSIKLSSSTSGLRQSAPSSARVLTPSLVLPGKLTTALLLRSLATSLPLRSCFPAPMERGASLRDRDVCMALRKGTGPLLPHCDEPSISDHPARYAALAFVARPDLRSGRADHDAARTLRYPLPLSDPSTRRLRRAPA